MVMDSYGPGTHPVGRYSSKGFQPALGASNDFGGKPGGGLTVGNSAQPLIDDNGRLTRQLSIEEAANIFFGKKIDNKHTDIDLEYDVENRIYPEAFTGSSPSLSRLIIHTITNNDTYVFTFCLPWKHRPEIAITWDELHFNDHLLDRLPNEGVASLTTQYTQQFQENQVRYGKSIHFEQDFYKTAIGIQNLQNELQQLMNASVFTCAFGAFQELLTKSQPPSVDDKYHQGPGASNSRHDIFEMFRAELDSWDVIKHPSGLDIIIDDCKRRLISLSGTPGNVTILPMGAAKYITDRYNETPEMLKTNGGRPITPGVQTSNGMFFESLPIKIGPHQGDYDLFFRNVTIGTFFGLTGSDIHDIPSQHYTTRMMNIKLFSEEKDDFFMLDYKSEIKKCGLYSDWDSPDPKLTLEGREWFGHFRTWGEFLENQDMLERVIDTIKFKLTNEKIIRMMEAMLVEYEDDSYQVSIEERQRTSERAQILARVSQSPPIESNNRSYNHIDNIDFNGDDEKGDVLPDQRPPYTDDYSFNRVYEASLWQRENSTDIIIPNQEPQGAPLRTSKIAQQGGVHTKELSEWIDSIDNRNNVTIGKKAQFIIQRAITQLQSRQRTTTTLDSLIPLMTVIGLDQDLLNLDFHRALEYVRTRYTNYITEFEDAYMTSYEQNQKQPSKSLLRDMNRLTTRLVINDQQNNDEGYLIRILMHPYGDPSILKRLILKNVDLEYESILCTLTSSSRLIFNLDDHYLRYLLIEKGRVKVNVPSTSVYLQSFDRRLSFRFSIAISCIFKRIMLYINQQDKFLLNDSNSSTDQLRLMCLIEHIVYLCGIVQVQHATIDLLYQLWQELDILYTQVFLADVIQMISRIILFVFTSASSQNISIIQLKLNDDEMTKFNEFTLKLISSIQSLAIPGNGLGQLSMFKHYLTINVPNLTTSKQTCVIDNDDNDEKNQNNENENDDSNINEMNLDNILQLPTGNYLKNATVYNEQELSKEEHRRVVANALGSLTYFQIHWPKLMQSHRTFSTRTANKQYNSIFTFDKNGTEWLACAISLYIAKDGGGGDNQKQRSGIFTILALADCIFNLSSDTNQLIDQYAAYNRFLDKLGYKNYKAASIDENGLKELKIIDYIEQYHISLSKQITSTDSTPIDTPRRQKTVKEPIELTGLFSIINGIMKDIIDKLQQIKETTTKDFLANVQTIKSSLNNIRKEFNKLYLTPQVQNLHNAMDVPEQKGGSGNIDNINKPDITPSVGTDALRVFLLRYVSLNNGRFWKFCIDNDIPVPIFYIGFRPHMQYHMGSMVHMKGYGAIGNTFYTQPSLEVGRNAANFTMSINFKLYQKAVITNSQGIIRAHNVFCDGYLGGNCHRVWNPNDQDEIQEYQTGQINKSIFLVPIPAKQRIHSPVLDIRGKFDEELMASSDADASTDYYGASIWARKWNWRSARLGRDTNYFNVPPPKFNTVVFQGHQQIYNFGKQDYDNITFEAGHWGKNVYPGVGKARRGKDKFILPIKTDTTATVKIVG